MSRLAKLAGGRAAALVVLLFQVGAPAVLGQTGSTGAGRVVFRPVPSVDTDQGVSAPEIVISPGLLGIELSVSNLGSEVKSVRPSIKVASGQWIRLAGRLTEADGASWSLGAELPYEPGMRVEVAVQVTSEGGEASRFTETQIWDGTQFVSASSFDWASISPEVAAFWDRLVGYFDFPEIGVPLQLSSVSSQSTVKFDPQAPSTEGGGHRFCFDLGEKANFILNIPGGLVYYDASPQPSAARGPDRPRARAWAPGC